MLDDDAEFISCSRQVPVVKTDDISSKKYWQDLYEHFDAQIRIPHHRRLTVLQEIFEERLLKKILKILPVDDSPIVESESTDSYNSTEESDVSAYEPPSEVRRRSSRKSSGVTTAKGVVDYRKMMLREMGSEMSMAKESANMYVNFLNQPENVAARWRPKPPITFTGMSLNEKSDAITLSIAKKFIDWLKALGGDETTTLDVPVIINLFEIGFNAHAADSLCVRVKELLSVTKNIANARHMPEASYTAHLYKQLYRDVNSIKKQEDMFAFGTMLPIEMREAPQKDNIATKWIQNKRVPENIASMSTVWEGIEHLRSTLGYCRWLRSHPEIDPPKYLDKVGMLDRSIDMEKTSHGSYDTDSVKF